MAGEEKDDEILVEDDLEIVEDDTTGEDEAEPAGDDAADEVAAEGADSGEGDPEPDPAADDESDEVLEAQGYKKDVRKRILREIRIRRQAEQAAEQAVEAARLREQEARTLSEKFATLQRGYATVLEGALSERLQARVEQLKAARAESDIDKETQIQGEIDDLRYKLSQVRDAASKLPPPPKDGEEVPPPVAAQPTRRVGPTPAEQWVARNQKWFENPSFAKQRRTALVIDQELAEEGFDKNDPEYFKELDRRLDDHYPSLRGKPKAGAVRQPVAAVSGGGTAPKPTGSKVVITRQDKETMMRFGLDPSNKEHLREYAKNKRAAA